MAYNPFYRAQDDVLLAGVLKVTPDIRLVHVNTHTVVSHMLVNMQARGLFVVMGPLVIIPQCQEMIGKAPCDSIHYKRKKKYWCTSSTNYHDVLTVLIVWYCFFKKVILGNKNPDTWLITGID